MGSKQSAVMMIANQMAREIVANQTLARLTIGFDGAIMAAHEVFQMGPGRSAAFREAYNRSVETLAHLFLDDFKETKDKQIDYAKGTRDDLIKKIVGEENFVPFDLAYGDAYIDELKRIRIVNKRIESEWISVEERLPEDEEVLVYFSYGKAPISGFDVDSYNHRAKRFVNYEDKVSHWMPLPLPPEVKA